MTGVELGQGIDSFQEMSREIEGAILDQGQYQDHAEIEMGLDVLNVGNINILPRIV